MFAHELSGMCKFDQKCSANLCSYQHSKTDKNGTEDEDIEENYDEISEDETDGQADDEQVGCSLCSCTFLDQDELDYHLKFDHIK